MASKVFERFVNDVSGEHQICIYIYVCVLYIYIYMYNISIHIYIYTEHISPSSDVCQPKLIGCLKDSEFTKDVFTQNKILVHHVT